MNLHRQWACQTCTSLTHSRRRWEKDQQFLEKEIDRLFAVGCVGVDMLLDHDSFRVVVHALDPFELESNIANMLHEADIYGGKDSPVPLTFCILLLAWHMRDTVLSFAPCSLSHRALLRTSNSMTPTDLSHPNPPNLAPTQNESSKLGLGQLRSFPAISFVVRVVYRPRDSIFS